LTTNAISSTCMIRLNNHRTRRSNSPRNSWPSMYAPTDRRRIGVNDLIAFPVRVSHKIVVCARIVGLGQLVRGRRRQRDADFLRRENLFRICGFLIDFV
jgi:hypothetical protein